MNFFILKHILYIFTEKHLGFMKSECVTINHNYYINKKNLFSLKVLFERLASSVPLYVNLHLFPSLSIRNPAPITTTALLEITSQD